MTVLHLLDHSLPLMSGYSTRSRSIVLFQHALGLRPVVLTSPKHPATSEEPELRDGIRHYRTPLPWGGAGLPYLGELQMMARLARRIRRVARAEGARVIHAHSPLLNGLPALWAARWLGLPLVYEARAFWEDAAVDHGTFKEGSFRYRLSRALETVVFRNADRVVTICEGMRHDVIGRGVAPERIEVVPNGVDVEWFRPQRRAPHVAGRFGLNGDPVFGFIGSFYHYEGLQFLLETLPKLRSKLPGARLLLVGGGPEEPALRKKAERVGDSIIFAGQVPHASIRDFYSAIDVFVCPRRRMRLTELVTPLKPLEAMAMAKPVLASDVGGLKELIQHDTTGLIFDAENGESFVREAARVGNDMALRARLGDAGRKHVESERTWERLVSRYLAMYTALV